MAGITRRFHVNINTHIFLKYFLCYNNIKRLGRKLYVFREDCFLAG